MGTEITFRSAAALATAAKARVIRAEYGNSGVMTFIVNHDGKVSQKVLGKNTASVAKGMTVYNPDKTWLAAKE